MDSRKISPITRSASKLIKVKSIFPTPPSFSFFLSVSSIFINSYPILQVEQTKIDQVRHFGLSINCQPIKVSDNVENIGFLENVHRKYWIVRECRKSWIFREATVMNHLELFFRRVQQFILSFWPLCGIKILHYPNDLPFISQHSNSRFPFLLQSFPLCVKHL